MIKRAVTLSLCAAALGGALFAQEGAIPKGIPHLDHVFVVMMENHGYVQIINNPSAPFINSYAQSKNLATHYFAIGHPSLTNYLETVGGSNFGVRSDNPPDWHSASCTPNIVAGTVSLESSSTPICPVDATGTDALTPRIDYTNETSGPPGVIDIDGIHHVLPNPNTVGKTIADQVSALGGTWKSYQESLPPQGANNVNNADGYFTDKSDLFCSTNTPPCALVPLYAVKHNPFVYFRSVQEQGLHNVAAFDGINGLWFDLHIGSVPTFSFIAPNQCDDMHGQGNVSPSCQFDPNNNGTQEGLNPGLIYLGDKAVQNIVRAIHASPVWKHGHNVIIVVWDENDYSIAPTTNQVVTIVDTNYGPHGIKSSKYYTHFSLLKSVEAGLSLPCLNNACDPNVSVMADVFADGPGNASDDDVE